MSLKKNLAYNFLLSLSQIAFPLISIPYIARVLDPEGIGKVSFIDSLTYYFIVIAEAGIVSYGIREVSRRRDKPSELKKLVSDLVSLHLLTSAISLILYIGLVALLYKKINDIRLILFSVSFLLVNAFSCEWYFWGTEKFRYITLRSLVTRLLGLASIFLLINEKGDYIIYYGIITVTAIANLIWNSAKLFADVDIGFKKIEWKKHVHYLIITYQISLVYSVVILLDNVFLQVLSTSAAVAYYAFAAKVVRISGALVTDALLVFYPRTVSLIFNKENEAFRHTVLRSSQLIVLITIPMAAGIFLLADQFTIVYFGNAFIPLSLNLKILALYPLLKAFSLFLNKQLLMPFDKEKLVLRGLWIGAIAFIVATIPLSYWFADKGTSMAVLFSEIAVLTSNIYCVEKLRLNIPAVDYRTALQAVAGSLLFLPVKYLGSRFIDDQLIRIIVEVVCCVSLYFIFIVFIIKNEMAVPFLRSFKSATANWN